MILEADEPPGEMTSFADYTLADMAKRQAEMAKRHLESEARRFWCVVFVERTERGDTVLDAAEYADEAHGRFMATFGGDE